MTAIFDSFSAAESHLLNSGWIDNGDGTYQHAMAVAHILVRGDGYSIHITLPGRRRPVFA